MPRLQALLLQNRTEAGCLALGSPPTPRTGSTCTTGHRRGSGGTRSGELGSRRCRQLLFTLFQTGDLTVDGYFEDDYFEKAKVGVAKGDTANRPY